MAITHKWCRCHFERPEGAKNLDFGSSTPESLACSFDLAQCKLRRTTVTQGSSLCASEWHVGNRRIRQALRKCRHLRRWTNRQVRAKTNPKTKPKTRPKTMGFNSHRRQHDKRQHEDNKKQDTDDQDGVQKRRRTVLRAIGVYALWQIGVLLGGIPRPLEAYSAVVEFL